MANGQAVSPGSTGQVRFTAADFRREIERVRRARRRNIALVVIAILLVVAAAAAAIFAFGVTARTVNDSDMEPVMSEGQSVLTVNAGEIRSGAVVAFHDDGEELRFGRVVAEPGDWVSVSPDGTVAVSDGALSAESAANVFGANAGSVTARAVPDNAYYVLGDAEDATVNGLTSEADFVNADQVVGQALVKVWPITSVGLVA